MTSTSIFSADKHSDQPIIPLSLFKDTTDSGAIKQFADRSEFIPIPNALLVTPDQEGQDFSSNAKFEYNHQLIWPEVVALFKSCAKIPWPNKEAAPLFSPTQFQTKLRWNGDGAPYRGFRCKANATTSAMLCIDADNKVGPVLHIDDAIDRLRQEQIEAIVYSTASNQTGDRFRIVIPLAEQVDPETQQQAVRALCSALKVGWKSDAGKNNCYSLFYVPGQYTGAANRFEHLHGDIRTAQQWIDAYPPTPTPIPIPEPTNANEQHHKKDFVSTWDAEKDARHILDEYRSLGSDRHIAMARWPVSLVMSALNAGYQIEEDELYDIIIREYQNNTPHSTYKPNELRRIARESLQKGRTNVGDDPAYLRPRIKSYAEQELEEDLRRSLTPSTCPDDFADEPNDDGEEEEIVATAPKTHKRRFFDEYLDLPEIEYWDDDKILPKKLDGTTCLVTGPWGCHKTNVTLTMMMDAVIKKQARVLFVPCEGAYGLAKLRVPAHCANRGFDIRELRGRFEFIPDGIDLTQAVAVKEFITENQDFMPDIVIIDTLAQAIPGIDMNTSLVGSLLGTNGPVGAIRRAFKCLVMILCHPPKSDDNAVLGHNSIVGNTDMILRVYDDKEKHRVMVKVKRNKDGPEGQELHYSFNPTGVPVPVRIVGELDNGLGLGVGARDFEADFMSRIMLIIQIEKLTNWQKSLSNREMAERLTLRVAGVTTDDEWNAEVDKTLQKLKNLQKRADDDSPYHKLGKRIKIPHSKAKDGVEWRWYSEPETIDPDVQKILKHVAENTPN